MKAVKALAASAVAVATWLATPGLGLAQSLPQTRTVVVSAVDKDGVPVKDLTATDLEIKVAGKVQRVVDIQPATGPLRIAVLVADGGTGGFQAGLAQFVQKLYGRAEFQFTSVLVQPEELGRYSGDRSGIIPALNRLGPRGSQRTGAQLVEAILGATTDIKSEKSRAVMLVARIGGEAASELDPKQVRSRLRESGAILYVVSVSGANRRPAETASAAGTDNGALARAQLADADAVDGAMTLGLILGDGSRESGGRHAEVVSNTMIKAFESVADELLGQYEVTYTVPDNLKPTDRFAVASKRRGLTVRAPSR